MAPVGSDLQEMGDFNPYHLIFFMGGGDVFFSRLRQAISSHFELLERWDTSHWHGIPDFGLTFLIGY